VEPENREADGSAKSLRRAQPSLIMAAHEEEPFMRHPALVLSVLLAVAAVSPGHAGAALLWDESPLADGDLADTSYFSGFSGEAPTDLGALPGGTHNLLGSTATPPTD